MATGNQTVTTADKHIDDVWVEGVIRALQFKTILSEYVDKTWDFVGHGDTYHKTRVPNIESQAKSASTDLNATVYTDTEQTVSINTHQACAIKHEDIAQLLSRNPVKDIMIKNMGYSLARAIDVNLATLPASFSQTVGTLAVDLTYDNLLRAVQYLQDAGYDMTDDICWMVAPAQNLGFMKMDTFVHAMYRGDANAQTASEKGKLGMFMGAPIMTSNLVKSNTGGHDNFLLHRESVALIMAQEPKTTIERIALGLADVAVVDQIYGFSEIDRYSETPGNITATDEGAVWLKGL